jgi:hypothetical protein
MAKQGQHHGDVEERTRHRGRNNPDKTVEGADAVPEEGRQRADQDRRSTARKDPGTDDKLGRRRVRGGGLVHDDGSGKSHR